MTDAPQSSVVLTWPDAENSELMEEFIGIVRGRTAHSSRTPAVRTTRRPAPDPRRGDPPGDGPPVVGDHRRLW